MSDKQKVVYELIGQGGYYEPDDAPRELGLPDTLIVWKEEDGKDLYANITIPASCGANLRKQLKALVGRRLRVAVELLEEDSA